MIERPMLLEKLIQRKQNGRVKIITGLRRSGKSFLLTDIYIPYLKSQGVDKDHIISLSLEELANSRYRNPFELDSFIRSKISGNGRYYIFLDEIQKVESMENPFVPGKENRIGFVDVILGLMKIRNLDIYITGSNSKMLSSDILTEFRGRGDEVKVHPLSYSEFRSGFPGAGQSAWQEYLTYGGLPGLLECQTHEQKSLYLKDLFENTYIRDILERNGIRHEKSVLDSLLNILSSSVGSLTNSNVIANTFRSVEKINIKPETIDAYISCFEDAFLLRRAQRFDVKGRKYIGSQRKYYFEDVGLRNARLEFRQTEESHIMENIIYNELIQREFDVDVGVVEYNHKDKAGVSHRSQLEVDFVANSGSHRYYIQSALNVADEEKRRQELNSLKRIPDSFKKILVVHGNVIPHHDENGILLLSLEDFLTDRSSIDF